MTIARVKGLGEGKVYTTGISNLGGSKRASAALSAESGYAMIWRLVEPGDQERSNEFIGIAPTGGASAAVFRRSISSTVVRDEAIYHTGNTTKSSDGTLKAASPVARIADADSTARLDIDESDFEWCGYGVANIEAHGIEIIRDDIGLYRVTGAKSLASSGWRLLPPRDPDGSGDLGVVTAEQVDDEIIISLFRRKMVLVDGEIVIQPGEPVDVPANSWIDVRLDMPEPVILPDAPVKEPQIHPE